MMAEKKEKAAAKGSQDVRIVMKYIDYWANEITQLLVLFIAIFALFSLDSAGTSIGETRNFTYALMLAGFAFLAVNWYKRKQFEKEIL